MVDLPAWVTSPDPAVVERNALLSQLGMLTDDPAISISELRDMTAHGANVNKAVKSQTSKTGGGGSVDVRNYGAVGSGAVNDVSAIQDAINRNHGKTIRLSAGPLGAAVYTVKGAADGPAVKLDSAGMGLELDPGVILRMETNDFSGYAVVEISAPDCVVRGGIIEGDLLTHTGVVGEWGHCVNVVGEGDRARILDTTIRYAWGDGIYLGNKVQDVFVDNALVESCRRQGISLVDAIRPHVNNSTFRNTGENGLTAPGCGMDIEPNPATDDEVTDFLVSNCLFINNDGGGVLINSVGLPVTGQFVNCRSLGNGGGYGGFYINAEGTPATEVTYSNCVAEDNTGAEGFMCGQNATANYYGVVSRRNKRGMVLNGRAIVAGAEVRHSEGNGLVVNSTAIGVILSSILSTGSGQVTAGIDVDIWASDTKMFSVLADAGTQATKPATGINLRAGATGLELHGCRAIGAYTSAAFADASTQSICKPKPDEPGRLDIQSMTTTNRWTIDADVLGAGVLGFRYLGGAAGSAKNWANYNRTNDIFFVDAASFRPGTTDVRDLGAAAQRWSRSWINQLVQQVATKTANYNMVVADHLIVGNASGLTISLPDPTVALAGVLYVVKNTFAGNLTVNSQGVTKTIDGAASKTLAQWEKLQVISDGAQWLTV